MSNKTPPAPSGLNSSDLNSSADLNNSNSSSLAIPIALGLMLFFFLSYATYRWYEIQTAANTRSQTAIKHLANETLPDFQLDERSGQPFNSAQMKGKVWVVTFFFSTCPGSCIRLNRHIKLLHSLEELQEVTFVSISCDPDTDTLPVLREYAKKLKVSDDQWLFCRGKMDYTTKLAQEAFKLQVYRKGHRDQAIIIGRDNRIRNMYDVTRQSNLEKIKDKLLECLAEPIPQELKSLKSLN